MSKKQPLYKHVFEYEDAPEPVKKPDWDYVPGFLDQKQAYWLLQTMLAQPWDVHSVDCSPGHKDAFRIFYGKITPSTSYGDRSAPRTGIEIPNFLSKLQNKIEAVTDCTYNFIEAHKFENTVRVYPHRDPPGTIAMVTVGQERVFRVGGYTKKDSAISNYRHGMKHHDFKEVLLEHGSLLIFYGHIAHSMEPSVLTGTRITLVYRYSTPAILEHGPGKKANEAGHKQQYEAAQKAWRETREVA